MSEGKDDLVLDARSLKPVRLGEGGPVIYASDEALRLFEAQVKRSLPKKEADTRPAPLS